MSVSTRARGSFLLDTNVVIALLSGDRRARNHLIGVARAAISLPAVVSGPTPEDPAYLNLSGSFKPLGDPLEAADEL